MDASRYFEEMHRAMSAQKNNSSLLLTVKVQDLGGADAYLELRQSPNGRARVFYSTMGRRNLNFQLFRKGWQLCHNASGEMTGQFPTRAENLLDSADFSACIRDDTLDAGRTEIILRELRRAAGTSRSCLPQSAREGAMITVESVVGRGGEWNYWSTRAADCLQKAGFSDRLARMPKGLDTCLYKDLDEDGVTISGGEAQKIAIARALYKDAPFIVLDEPTAALDPVAEAEIYAKFNEIAGDKTAIYISHRLSSCKFCDEIAVFDHGEVVQQGTHEELLGEPDGKYYELWNAQAQYYTEESA